MFSVDSSVADWNQIKKNRLRWFGRVERKDDSDWVKHCMTLEVEGVKQRGQSTPWWDCVKDDMESLGPFPKGYAVEE